MIILNSLTFLAITLLSGAISGIILSFLNLLIVEFFIDQAINLETQKMVLKGQHIDMAELGNYRVWQKSGSIIAGAVYGIAFASFLGIIFVYIRKSLPGSNNKRKALVLVGILWVVIFLAVSLKYPANPPAVGDPDTIYYRELLYVGFIIFSGSTALVLALIHKKLRSSYQNKVLLPIIYAVIMIAAYFMFPPNPDQVDISTGLIFNFRVASGFTIGIFWITLGIIFGSLWDKFKPYEQSKITIV